MWTIKIIIIYTFILKFFIALSNISILKIIRCYGDEINWILRSWRIRPINVIFMILMIIPCFPFRSILINLLILMKYISLIEWSRLSFIDISYIIFKLFCFIIVSEVRIIVSIYIIVVNFIVVIIISLKSIIKFTVLKFRWYIGIISRVWELMVLIFIFIL